MEIIDIGCPRSLDLSSIISNKEEKIKSILQTISIYDHIIISQDIKNIKNVLIKSNDNISQSLYEKLNELLLLYSNYVGLIINNISIDIKYDNFSYLRTDENILAGFILALNYYFKINITTHELIYLVNKIDPLISFYINGGYKKIDDNNKPLYIGNNLFNKYYLLDKFDDMEKLKKICDKYNIILSSSNCNFITSQDNINSSIINIKKLISNININTVNNVKEHKILVKYIK